MAIANYRIGQGISSSDFQRTVIPQLTNLELLANLPYRIGSAKIGVLVTLATKKDSAREGPSSIQEELLLIASTVRTAYARKYRDLKLQRSKRGKLRPMGDIAYFQEIAFGYQSSRKAIDDLMRLYAWPGDLEDFRPQLR